MDWETVVHSICPVLIEMIVQIHQTIFKTTILNAVLDTAVCSL